MTANINTSAGPKAVEVRMLAEFSGYQWFVHLDTFGDYAISEWSTGQRVIIPGPHMTPGALVDSARDYLNRMGPERIAEVVQKSLAERGQVNEPIADNPYTQGCFAFETEAQP